MRLIPALRTALRISQMQQLVEQRVNATGLESLLKGITVTEGGDGSIVCEFPLANNVNLLNGKGTLHGGMTATIVDAVSTWALVTKTGPSKPGVSIDLSVTYMKAAMPTDVLLIESKTLKVGKNLAFLTVDIRNKNNGQLIAQGKHTKFVGYMKAAMPTDVLLIESKTLKVGKNLAFLTVDIRNKNNGQLIAQGKHTKFVG